MPSLFASNLHQPQSSNIHHMSFGSILLSQLPQKLQKSLIMLLLFHINEIHQHNTANIPQPQLVHNFHRRLLVQSKSRFPQADISHKTASININNRHSLSFVYNQKSPRSQGNLTIACTDCFSLDFIIFKYITALVQLQPIRPLRRHALQQILNPAIDNLIIYYHLFNILVKQIPHNADNQIHIPIQKACALHQLGLSLNRLPNLNKIANIPLDTFLGLAHSSSANNHTHILWASLPYNIIKAVALLL